MKTFQNFALDEGLIRIPPKIYKQFENALFTFAFSHMIAETELGIATAVKKVAKRHGIRRFVRSTVIKSTSSYKDPHQDMPYLDQDVDTSDKITLFMVYDKREASFNSYYDEEHEKTGNPAITFYVFNYVRELLEADKENEAILIIDQILSRIEADLKHELMHYVQDVFLSNKSEKQVQTGNPEDEVEYYISQKEFDPTIRSEIGEFLATRRHKPSLQKHIKQSKFFGLLKKHKPEKYKIASKKFVMGVQRALDSKGKTK